MLKSMKKKVGNVKIVPAMKSLCPMTLSLTDIMGLKKVHAVYTSTCEISPNKNLGMVTNLKTSTGIDV